MVLPGCTSGVCEALSEELTSFLVHLLQLSSLPRSVAIQMFLAPDDGNHAPPVLCCVCGLEAAIIYCQQCEERMCESCRKSLHQAAGKGSHISIVLFASESSATVVTTAHILRRRAMKGLNGSFKELRGRLWTSAFGR